MAQSSRIGVKVTDCKTDDLSEELAFRKAALGCRGGVDADAQHAHLRTSGPLRVLLQRVAHEPRVHIETDDREAERARLEAAGAKTVANLKGWHIIGAPTGHRFCIVKPQKPDFPARSAKWGELHVLP